MSLGRFVAALLVAVRNGSHSFHEFYALGVDPLARDRLTLAWNRDQFERRQQETSRYSLLLVDVDDFKRINDRFGHQVGDVVLKGITNALRTEAGDRIFRVGGEEFAVLLAGCSPEDALGVAERLRAVVQGLEVLDGMSVTISIGVAHTELPAKNPGAHASVFAAADAALYRAKGQGKNRVESGAFPRRLSA